MSLNTVAFIKTVVILILMSGLLYFLLERDSQITDIRSQLDKSKQWRINHDIWSRTWAMDVEMYHNKVNNRLDDIEGQSR